MAKVNTNKIAEKLKLSRTTVSKALNNHPNVPEHTKQRVFEMARQLGYEKIKKNDDLLNTPPVKPGNNTICFLVPSEYLISRYWLLIFKSAEEYCRKFHYPMTMGIIEKNESAKDIPHALQGSKPAGVVLVGEHDKNFYKGFCSLGFPVVTIDTAADIYDNNLFCDVITMCNEACTYEITETLIQKQRQKIAFAGIPNRSRSTKERWKGYYNAMKAYNLPILSEFSSLQSFGTDGGSLKEIGKVLNEMKELPDAIICVNDLLALNTYGILEKMGIRIPEDIAITGFDNFDSFDVVRKNQTELTSVIFDIEEIGRIAARQLLYRIDNPKAPLSVYRLESHVIYRKSTDC